MSLVDGNGGLTAADVAAVTRNNGGNGFGWGGDGSWWLIVLFLFALSGNGWGNGFGGNGGMMPFMMGSNTQADVQRGFDQSAVMAGINGINTALANAEVSRCNNQMTTLQAINTIGYNQQNCCCENRLATANLQSVIQSENCADRAAISDGIRDILTATQAQTQTILDKMCQQEIDALKTQNANLQTQINLANLQASQTAQTARILADNAAQTVALEQYLNPTPVPAYVVANPNCCSQYYNNGCGCGM